MVGWVDRVRIDILGVTKWSWPQGVVYEFLYLFSYLVVSLSEATRLFRLASHRYKPGGDGYGQRDSMDGYVPYRT